MFIYSVKPKNHITETQNYVFLMSSPIKTVTPEGNRVKRYNLTKKHDEMYKNLVKLCYYYFCKKKPDMWNATKTTGASWLVLKSAS